MAAPAQPEGHWQPHTPCTIFGCGAPKACPGCVVLMPFPRYSCSHPHLSPSLRGPIIQTPQLPALSTHPHSQVRPFYPLIHRSTYTFPPSPSQPIQFNILCELRPDSWGGKGCTILYSHQQHMKRSSFSTFLSTPGLVHHFYYSSDFFVYYRIFHSCLHTQ